MFNLFKASQPKIERYIVIGWFGKFVHLVRAIEFNLLDEGAEEEIVRQTGFTLMELKSVMTFGWLDDERLLKKALSLGALRAVVTINAGDSQSATLAMCGLDIKHVRMTTPVEGRYVMPGDFLIKKSKEHKDKADAYIRRGLLMKHVGLIDICDLK